MSAFTDEQYNTQLVREKSVAVETRKRLSPYLYETIPTARQAEHEAAGWVQDRKLKRSVVMRRLKPQDQLFVDRTWAAFAKLRFPLLNKGSSFNLHATTATEGLAASSEYVSVFAADEEVALVILCRTAESAIASSFKQEIEAIQATRAESIRAFRSWIPGRKIKFVLATNNFIVSEATLDRLKEADIVHMDEDTIDYYLDLAEHLGPAAGFSCWEACLPELRFPGWNHVSPPYRARWVDISITRS